MSQSGSYNAGGGGGGTVTTLTGNTGGAVGPTAGNINVVGSGVIAVAGNPGTSTLTISASGGVPTSFPTDSGTAVPSGGDLEILGGSNINTSGATNVVTVNLDNTVSISGSMTAGTGFTATTGDVNIIAGNLDLPLSNASATEGCINMFGLRFMSSDAGGGGSVSLGFNAGTTAGGAMGNGVAIGLNSQTNMTAGAGNVTIGGQCGITMDIAQQNNAVGCASLGLLTSGSSNQAIGFGALGQLVDGNYNIAIGESTGNSYTASESDNILMGYNVGDPGDNGVIRIGSTSGASIQTSCFIAGIQGVTPAMSPQMVTIGTDGELGSQAIPSGGITTLDGDTGSATGSTVTIAGGSNITTSATGSTLTVDLDSTVSISGSMTAGTGFEATTGDVTIDAGNINLPATNNGGTHGVVLWNTLPYLHTYGGSSAYFGQNAGNTSSGGGGNVGIGTNALTLNSGGNNVCIGQDSGGNITSGQNNTAIGSNSLSAIVTGTSNTCIGRNAGNAYNAGELFNICIANTGVAGESQKIRIGDGANQISTFIAGIYGVTPANSPQMVTIGSDGEMGSQAIASGGISTLDGDSGSATGSTVTIAGGTGITTSATGATVTIDNDGVITINGDSGSATGNTITIAGGTNVTTSATGSTVTIDASGGGMTWSEQAGTTQAMAVGNGYILNNAGLVTATLPATAAVGDLMEIVGKGAGGWLMAQNSGQTVHFGNQNTTTGAGGSLASTNRYDCISIICTTANTDFVIKSSIGNLTVV